jgi:hypothetical protein
VVRLASAHSRASRASIFQPAFPYARLFFIPLETYFLVVTKICYFLTKITDYDEIGSLRIMTQRNGKLRLRNEKFDWLLFQSFDFCHNKEVRF